MGGTSGLRGGVERTETETPGDRACVGLTTVWVGICLAIPVSVSAQASSAGESDSVETIRHGDTDETNDDEDEGTEPASNSEIESIDHGFGEDETEGDSQSGDESREDADEGDSGTESASDAGFRAGYGTGLWVDTVWDGGDEDVVEWRGDLDLELKRPLSPNWSAVARIEFRYWMGGEENPSETDVLVNASSPRASAEVRVGESYALYEGDRWAFRAGHLRNPWGSTTLVRPGDVVNAVDATGFSGLGDDGSELRPQPTLEASYVRPDWRLTALIVPFFVPNRTTLFGRDSAVAGARGGLVGSDVPIRSVAGQFLDSSVYEEAQPLLNSPARPDERPENASLGARWTGTFANTDLGVGYFWGWDRTPMLRVDSSLRELLEIAVEDGRVLRDFDLQGFLSRNPMALSLLDRVSDKRADGETLFEARHRRMHSIVVDATRQVGPIGLSADVTLQPERTFVTREFRTARRPTMFTAVGATYQRLIGGEPLVATLEGFWLAAAPRDAGVTELFVDASDRGRPNAKLALVDGGYGGLAGAFDWQLPVADLGMRVGGIVETGGGVVVNARLSRRWSASVETSVGLALFEGPAPSDALTLGGLYDRNDRVGIRLSGSF